ncbi:MAG: hypothetical protein JWR15_1304 [Prosthecobacter sp.]|nr:hypothetical protein [Prosthecobacter sp.]
MSLGDKKVGVQSLQTHAQGSNFELFYEVEFNR